MGVAGGRLAPPTAAFAALLSLGAGREPLRDPRAATLIDHLMLLETEHKELLLWQEDRPRLRDRLETLAAEVRPALAALNGGAALVKALNGFVYQHLKIQTSQDLGDPANLLPSSVLERRRGYCVGIAALQLALAERLGLSVFAVATPSHVFLRYEDGAVRINIETSRQGADIPDEKYVRQQRIPEESIRRGVFMRNLTAGEFLAQVHNNLGVIYSKRKDYGRAAREYRRALELDPRIPAAYYNHGNDLLAQGRHRAAVRMFSKSLRLYPTDVWALNYRGLAYAKGGNAGRARRDFKAALGIEPEFEAAKTNLARLGEGRDRARDP